MDEPTGTDRLSCIIRLLRRWDSAPDHIRDDPVMARRMAELREDYADLVGDDR